MLNPCCDEMRSFGRDHYPGASESDLSDALIEMDREGYARLLTTSGRFDKFILFCPWCGTRIGKPPGNFPEDYNPFD